MRTLYQWIALVSLGICIASLLYHFFRLIRLGSPKDYSKPSGKIAPSVLYSFTGAMNPAKKESAFLHLPTYTAGVIYHFGSFLSIILFFVLFFRISIIERFSWLISGMLLISAICGLGMLIKRIVKKALRHLSNPDDYISNALVTLYQVMTALTMINRYWIPAYFIITSLLLLYIPLVKLKHVIYFFAARYHLGFFFGWRGIWPPRKVNL